MTLAAWAGLGGLARSCRVLEIASALDDCIPFRAVAEVAGPPPGPVPGAGAGLSRDEALAAAAGEAVERNFAGTPRTASSLRAAPADLGDDAVDPRDLVLPATGRADADPDVDVYDSARTIDWTRARWLDSGEPVWVPALLAHHGYEPPCGERFCSSTTSGLAAGVDPDAADQAAVRELVERDAVVLTWLARLPGVRLGLDDSCDPGVRETVGRLERLGAELELYSLDVGLEMPVVVCIAFGDGVTCPGAVVGSAAGASVPAAVRRAVVETATVAPLLRGMLLLGHDAVGDGPPREPIDHAISYLPAESRRAFDFLRRPVDEAVPMSEIAQQPDRPLDEWAARARGAGVRVAVADVTSPLLDTTPWRVARALGTHAQPLDFGMRCRRLANPRLERFLAGVPPNPDPHPLA